MFDNHEVTIAAALSMITKMERRVVNFSENNKNLIFQVCEQSEQFQLLIFGIFDGFGRKFNWDIFDVLWIFCIFVEIDTLPVIIKKWDENKSEDDTAKQY